jgi:hypothetical protein
MAALTQNITRFESHGRTVHVADLTGRAVHPARTHNRQPVVEREQRPDADEDDGLVPADRHQPGRGAHGRRNDGA